MTEMAPARNAHCNGRGVGNLITRQATGEKLCEKDGNSAFIDRNWRCLSKSMGNIIGKTQDFRRDLLETKIREWRTTIRR